GVDERRAVDALQVPTVRLVIGSDPVEIQSAACGVAFRNCGLAVVYRIVSLEQTLLLVLAGAHGPFARKSLRLQLFRAMAFISSIAKFQWQGYRRLGEGTALC